MLSNFEENKTFNNTKPNIILLTDYTDVLTMQKQYGAHKIAYQLRIAGYEVAVINHLSVFTVDEIKHLLESLVTEQTLFVGVNNFYYSSTENVINNFSEGIQLKESELGSILPHGKNYNFEIRKLIKNKNPKCSLICGGPNTTDSNQNKDFDYVVLGYAEKSIVNLANHLAHNTTLDKSYRSIYGPIIINDPKADGYDFSQSYIDYEDHDIIFPDEVLSLEVARGCIFKCTFCQYPFNGKKKLDYIRSRDLIVAELLSNFKKFKTTKYIILDDTFNDSVEKCQMMLEISKILPFKLEYWAYIRLDLLAAKPETIPMLIDSGCRAMFFGIETFNQKTAITIKKGGSRKKMQDTIKHIKNIAGNQISLNGSFIFGLPHEDLKSMQKTIDYLLSDDNLLDTWEVAALRIRNKQFSSNLDNSFLSELDLHYEDYGYRPISNNVDNPPSSVKQKWHLFLWENDYTDYTSMAQLASEVMSKMRGRNTEKFYNTYSFMMSGLGIPLDDLLTVPKKDVNLNKIDCKKMRRAVEYKKLLFKKLKVPNFDYYNRRWTQDAIKFRTYSNYLIFNSLQKKLNKSGVTEMG